MSSEVTGITPEVYRAVVQIVDERMKEIKVTREDFDQLRRAVEEAQARSEKRFAQLARPLAGLAEAQKQMEQLGIETRRELKELAEAQQRTEQVMAELGVAQKETRREVGRLSDSFLVHPPTEAVAKEAGITLAVSYERWVFFRENTLKVRRPT